MKNYLKSNTEKEVKYLKSDIENGTKYLKCAVMTLLYALESAESPNALTFPLVFSLPFLMHCMRERKWKLVDPVQGENRRSMWAFSNKTFVLYETPDIHCVLESNELPNGS